MLKYKTTNGEIIEVEENHANLCEREGFELVVESTEEKPKSKKEK